MRSTSLRWTRIAGMTGGAVATALLPVDVAAASDPSGVPAVYGWLAGVVLVCLAGAALFYRHRARAATLESARLRADTALQSDFLAHGPVRHFRWDPANDSEDASPGVAELLGRPADERIRFSDFTELFEPDDAATLTKAALTLRETGAPFDLSMTMRDGSRVLHMTGTCSKPAAGRPAAAAIWITDESVLAATVEALTARTESFRRLLDFLPLPVWRRRPDLKLDFVNRAYEEAVEAEPNTDPESLPELAAALVEPQGGASAAAVTTTGPVRSLERHIVIGGARRLLEVNEAPLPGDDSVAGFALDRTEIDDIKSELSRHITGHEEVLHNLGTAIAIYGADERLTFFNNSFLRLWHLDEAWLRGSPALGEVLEALRDNRRIPETANFPAFKTEQMKLFTSLLAPVEELTHLPDGTTLRSMVTPHPFGGLLFTWEDVTDALALERSYNTLIAVQQETLDNLYEGVAVIGADGRLRLSNPAFGRMWQMPAEELAAEPHIADLVERMRDFIDEGGDWPAQKEQTIGLLTDREGRTGRIERSDGSVLDCATVPLPDGAMLLSYLNVSDSIRVERALREKNEALETADRLKSEFIANVSYELRTPLNTIIGFTEILKGEYFGSLNQRQTEYSSGILESSHQLLALINDILDLAIIEAGHMTLELNSVDLRDLLSGIISLSRERMRKKKLTLEFDCPENIGTVVVDERRLKQAFFNIISNSVKFTPEEGTIGISAERVNDDVVLVFSDSGIGIIEADQSRVFLRFERGSNAEARRSGAGLGLSLVKSFVELHGGHVELESEPGAGTRIRCVLPSRTEQDMETRVRQSG